MNLSRNSSAFYLSTSTIILPNFAALSLPYCYNDNGAFGLIAYSSCWIDIGWGWSFIYLTIDLTDLIFIGMIGLQRNSLHVWVIGVTIKTCYYSYRSDFHKSDLFPRQFTLFMNCTLGSTIYLGPNAVMTARQSSHKSKFLFHFRIVVLSRRIVLW